MAGSCHGKACWHRQEASTSGTLAAITSQASKPQPRHGTSDGIQRHQHKRRRRAHGWPPSDSLPELFLRLRSPGQLTTEDSLPPPVALTVDKDFLAPALVRSVLRLHILGSTMFLRQSNVKLQEELRDTMKSYGEEKSMLRAQLANLRLDLNELHHDDRTVTTEETASHYSLSNNSEAELKRLVDFEGETGNRSLQLPAIKNMSMSPTKSSKNATKDSSTLTDNNQDRDKEEGAKSLRFTSEENKASNKDKDRQSFLENPSWETKHESQKFLELQRNQEVLRNIGRAQLREKRQSLIRLPTINSAKKRTSLWDSGKNVSRPKGKSTDFELHPYVEDAIVLSRKHFLIPSIKDPQRSEITLKGPTKRPTINKRKVQFRRPQEAAEIKAREVVCDTNVATEASSLNTTMADVSLEDNTLGNITFDDDVFKHMMNKDILESNNKTAHDTLAGDVTSADKTVDDSLDDEDTFKDDSGLKDEPLKSDNGSLPPLKVNYLAKKNLELHNTLNKMRVPPLHISPRSPKPSESPEAKSLKDSDRSVGTKLSLMSQQTQMSKSMYLKNIDPKRRSQALSDIMFAVRSRMRENEDAMRFGQTPRPRDQGLDDYMLPRPAASTNTSSVSSLTPRWNDGSPRKPKTSKRGPVLKTERQAAAKRKNSHVTEVQSYLRKMYRNRKTIDRMAGNTFKVSHFAGHKQLRMVAQQA